MAKFKVQGYIVFEVEVEAETHEQAYLMVNDAEFDCDSDITLDFGGSSLVAEWSPSDCMGYTVTDEDGEQEDFGY